ncbi:MAG: heavy-metal-associated domain-containing protein [Acidobacterium ailaaui]|nr:heavy-metal-associated domain-containing protein [Pseudacidobacterium ailaaui]
MSCMSCVATVKKSLSSIDGVVEVKVSLQDKNATVKYDPKKVTTEQLKNTINKIGYKAGDIKNLKE